MQRHRTSTVVILVNRDRYGSRVIFFRYRNRNRLSLYQFLLRRSFGLLIGIAMGLNLQSGT